MAPISLVKQAKIDQKRLKEIVSYDPDTGIFKWVSHSIKNRIGRPSGSFDCLMYVTLTLDKMTFRAHRAAYLYMTGEWPEFFIDHIDGDPSNNKWENLRHVTPAENSMNQKVHRGETTLRSVSNNIRRLKTSQIW